MRTARHANRPARERLLHDHRGRPADGDRGGAVAIRPGDSRAAEPLPCGQAVEIHGGDEQPRAEPPERQADADRPRPGRRHALPARLHPRRPDDLFDEPSSPRPRLAGAALRSRPAAAAAGRGLHAHAARADPQRLRPPRHAIQRRLAELQRFSSAAADRALHPGERTLDRPRDPGHAAFARLRRHDALRRDVRVSRVGARAAPPEILRRDPRPARRGKVRRAPVEDRAGLLPLPATAAGTARSGRPAAVHRSSGLAAARLGRIHRQSR